MARVVTLAFSVVIAATAAHAETLTPQQIDTLNNLQEEFSTCVALLPY